MKFTQLFTKTRKEVPKDETAANAQLLTRGGFVFKNMAGVYSFLPMGVRVLNKIRQIIRDEMDAIGGQEVYLSVFQDKTIWDKTKRWNIDEVMYTWQEDHKDFGLGFTHEEVVAQIGSQNIHSYKDLPKFVYQIQTKFRKEQRPQGGLLRGREFEMKDLYSLTRNEKELTDFYEKCAHAYTKIFGRVGLQAIRTKAHGGVFSQGSEEFQVLGEVGEDTIFYCDKDNIAINKELFNAAQGNCEKCGKTFIEKKAIEVGNIFKLGTKFSEPLGLMFVDEKGKEQEVWMGSYGIGTGRLMATVVEVHHDKAGIVWPAAIAPFSIYLIGINKNAGEVYDKLQERGVEALYDDREDISVGQKLADADLIGCPLRVVVSPKTGDKVELKHRNQSSSNLVSLDKAIDIAQDL